MGLAGQSVPPDRDTEAGRGFDRWQLADGGVTGDEVATIVFPVPMRIYWYPWLVQWLTGATSLVSMAAQRQRVVADSPSPVKTGLGDLNYGSRET